jgi:peptide/nickel transport system permease protein
MTGSAPLNAQLKDVESGRDLTGTRPVRKRTVWTRMARSPKTVVGFGLLILLVSSAVFAPWITPHSPSQTDIMNLLAPPSSEHLLGTDQVGRDALTRIIYGARASLAIGIFAAAIAVTVGMGVGVIAGYFGGYAEHLLMRFTDAAMSIPLYFLWITILTLFGASFVNVMLVLGLTNWMRVARVVRGDVLKIKEFDFVEAARAIGARDAYIVLRHISPNVIPIVTVAATLAVAQAILAEAALSFLGLGVQPPTPSWGNMLTDAQTYIWSAPLLVTVPGICIFVTVVAFSLVGEALRDALDPRQWT